MALRGEPPAIGFPLKDAWRRLADHDQPELELEARYEALHKPAISGEPTDHPDRFWEVFEPKSGYARGKYADRRQWLMRGRVLDDLKEGRLIATGVMISPELRDRRTAIPPSMLRVLDYRDDGLDWDESVIKVGVTIFSDVNVKVAAERSQRGRPDKQSAVRKAIVIALKHTPHLANMPLNAATKTILEVFDANPRLLPIDGVSNATIARAFRKFRDAPMIQN